MKSACLRLFCLAAVSLLAVACGTTVRSYRVEPGGARKGGIPFYPPVPHVHVKQAFEVSRDEGLFAVLEIGGIERFLAPLVARDVATAEQELEALLALRPDELLLALSEAPSAALTELTVTTVLEDKDADTKETHTETTKFTLIPAAAVEDSPPELLYTASDASKVVELVMLPNLREEWELVVTPGWFSSVNTNVNLADGWRLSSVGADSNNDVLEAVSDLAGAVVGATKEVKAAKIAADQAIKVQQLKNQAPMSGSSGGQAFLTADGLFDSESSGPAPTSREPADPESAGPDRDGTRRVEDVQAERDGQSGDQTSPTRRGRPEPVTAGVHLLGFARRVDLEVVRPGLYPVSGLQGGRLLPTEHAHFWTRMGF